MKRDDSSPKEPQQGRLNFEAPAGAPSSSPPARDLVPRHWRDEEQIENARRVGGAIGRDVLRFCRQRMRQNLPEFHMKELTDAVEQFEQRAPDSPGRILRLLRQSGLIHYTVVNRAKSQYRLDRVVFGAPTT